jgi:hypothetical protein
MDFTPLLQPIYTALWYLIPIILVGGILKSPWFKGKFGEFLVNLYARLFLDKSRYHLIKNVTLPTEDGTTQIDHVLISEFGVFVVETKNMKGWIFGSPHQRLWTQKIFRSSHKFQNPLHQNYKHVKTLQQLLGLNDHQMHSVVVFVGDSTFKTSMPENVIKGFGYVLYIKSKKDRVLSPEQVAEAVRKVASGRLKASLATDWAHNRHVQGLVAERYGVSPRRSNGGGLLKILAMPVLVLGIGAIAVNAYSNFVSEASSIVTKKAPEQPVKTAPAPAPSQSEIKPKAEPQTATKKAPEVRIQRVDQPPSKLFLAKQECNSLIAAALGSQDPRLLRGRDKACARYKALRGEVH